MQIHEITAKSLLTSHSKPDPWFGCKYTMNIYRGCQHLCIYCDSRSDCYQIPVFEDIYVKTNAIELLRNELPRKRIKGTIGTGAMSDPYIPLEKKLRLTRQALELIAQYRFPIHIITKSDMVTRDIDLLKRISLTYAAVSMTITTCDDELAAKVEPYAPSPSKRLAALKQLSDNGIYCGITLMPVLPFIEDNTENIVGIVETASAAGVKYIIPSFGMTLRSNQRAYYYEKLDQVFPGLRAKYEDTFGENYGCDARNSAKLEAAFNEAYRKHKIKVGMDFYKSPLANNVPKQIGLFAS